MHAGSGATRVHMRWSRCKRPLRTPPCGVEEPLLHEHHTPGTRHLTPPSQKTFSAATAAAQPSQDPISANPPAAAALPPPRGALGGAAGGGLSGLESLAIGGSPGFYISTPRGTDGVGFGHRFTPH